ncbi:acyl-CoA dehydrogenase family protein [Oscillatoria sp. CS-180]|uniref:acyl-CoA dehydrogenase family protein n=1 Tax=Oscillatoria sp. CS-180 TaxID=3021720 RepID=UPI00232F2B15|nr:acyl-CoA dehydrogenase family protein [Oscillatoria sp. CS-180]MDB9527426.1 acyl-CoA dehydrogenase family protein [Oscillatoria sp. CS-180]
MTIDLTDQQQSAQAKFRTFVAETVSPYASQWDREESTSPNAIAALAQQGYLGATLPTLYGGQAMDALTFGLLNEEIGRVCSSLRSLLTVHCMVSQALLRWGSRDQKEYWLPRLATGDTIAAFGLSEPNVGSDAQAVETTAVAVGDRIVLNGHKRWITYGQVADLLLVFAQWQGQMSAFLVERSCPNLSIQPMSGLLGVRASMLAELRFEDCVIPQANLVCRQGLGLSHVASTALDWGRYSVAWGCVGIAQACLDACLLYTSQRQQFGHYLKEHQLIQQMITNMLVNVRAARALCYQAAKLRVAGDSRSIMETSIAKYFASTAASQIANDAVQIHGGNGCSGDYPVERYFRDAKIMEIIEGSTQIQQMTLAAYGYQDSVAQQDTSSKSHGKPADPVLSTATLRSPS